MPTQKQLFQMLRDLYDGKHVCRKGKFILVQGEAPILLVAHLDTVHKEPVRDICMSQDGNLLMSPQGVGGDDRCGVYALAKVYDVSPRKPWLLFTCDEEIGGNGARAFAEAHQGGTLPKKLDSLKLVVEIDRRGENDAVYYDCDNEDFEAYIASKGFRTAFGSFSDISIIAPALRIAAVNLSAGYYNAHSLSEYINRAQLETVIGKVASIVSDAARENFPRFEYIEIDRDIYLEGCCGYYDPPSDLPKTYRDVYDELLDYYDPMEIEGYRETYGNEILRKLYEFIFGEGSFPRLQSSKGKE